MKQIKLGKVFYSSGFYLGAGFKGWKENGQHGFSPEDPDPWGENGLWYRSLYFISVKYSINPVHHAILDCWFSQ